MKKRSNILLLILLLMSQAVSAQKFTIESMQATNDLSAGTYITNACIQSGRICKSDRASGVFHYLVTIYRVQGVGRMMTLKM